MVASGERLSCSGCYTQLSLQGIPLVVDLYVLSLKGYYIVLGTQWLQILGSIIWDFFKNVNEVLP
ncbi:hypothetical protein Pint_15779 [Pistacia integerrima]|uniref:Uncharacterized protein n=1 Tax=Pistacia integerrima TaxID=434235 RepID=A0ACC0ZA30_9ROSI|nr:hypothetical protein Pint_15779 [Pistacia integerrima]